MEINPSINIKKTPSTKPLIPKNNESYPRKHKRHYRWVIGMLNYLTGSTHPGLVFATH